MSKLRNTIDVSKFRKSLTKSIDGISFDAVEPVTWISTGNYALNYLISSDFFKGIPLSTVSCFGGITGAGKSFLASGNVVKNAQAQGVLCVVIDSEYALYEGWLKNMGVSLDSDKLIITQLSLVDEVGKFINTFMEGYNEDYGTLPMEEQPPVLIVIDSLAALTTSASIAQFEGGDMSGDFGILPKKLKQLAIQSMRLMGNKNVGLLATNHTRESGDKYKPDEIQSGGRGFQYMSSIVLNMSKGKLKEDEDGNATKDVMGMRSICKLAKSRFNHRDLHKSVDVNIPFDTGIDPYSGLFDLFDRRGVFVKEGHRYLYKSKVDNYEFKEFRKNISHEQFMKVMQDFVLVKDQYDKEIKPIEE